MMRDFRAGGVRNVIIYWQSAATEPIAPSVRLALLIPRQQRFWRRLIYARFGVRPHSTWTKVRYSRVLSRSSLLREPD